VLRCKLPTSTQLKPSIFDDENPAHRRVARIQYQFDEKVDKAIEKSVKSALRFFDQARKQAITSGLQQKPPSFEEFVAMARNVMEASKRVDSGRLRNASLRELLEHTWSQKLLNYATQKQLRDRYDSLIRRY
jgi:hypothetical protein